MSTRSDTIRSHLLTGSATGSLNIEPLQTRACTQGYVARLRGRERSRCPHRGQLAAYWRLGWDNAENDRKGRA